MSPEYKAQFDSLKQRVETLEAEMRLNNFTGHQDFNKYSNFTTTLKVPSYTTAPATCQIGEIIEVSGELQICSAADTWTVVGTQS